MRRLLAAWFVIILALPLVNKAAPSIVHLDLQLSDLPAGSTPLSSTILTAAQLAKEPNHPGYVLLHKGFVVEHDAMFTIGEHMSLRLSTNFQQYVSAAQAHAAYLLSLPPDLGGFGPQVQWLGGSEGDERTAQRQIEMVAGSRHTIIIIIFRRGSFLWNLLITGESAAFPPAQAVRLAKIVDARIQHAS